jgi:hypothetical protein
LRLSPARDRRPSNDWQSRHDLPRIEDRRCNSEKVRPPSEAVDEWVAEEFLDQKSVEMIDVQEKLTEETKSDFLKKELARLKEERCVLVNKLFAVTKKYSHLKSVRDIDLAIQQARQQDQRRDLWIGRAFEAEPVVDGHRAAAQEH